MISFGKDRRGRALDGTLVPIYAYNGGHKWRPGPVELRPAKKGKAHYGPGLYLTTSLKTAAEYAKGGGVISRFTLAPLTFDTDIDMGIEEALGFVKAVPGLHERRELVDVLRRYTSGRSGITLGQVMNIVLSTPSNGVGKVGVALAKAAMSKGADASLVTRAASEDWFTLWNMDKVLKREVVKTGQPGVEWHLPTVMDLRRAGVATPPWEPLPGIELDDSDLPKIHAKLPSGGKS